jgi:hypothetical protein
VISFTRTDAMLRKALRVVRDGAWGYASAAK